MPRTHKPRTKSTSAKRTVKRKPTRKNKTPKPLQTAGGGNCLLDESTVPANNIGRDIKMKLTREFCGKKNSQNDCENTNNNRTAENWGNNIDNYKCKWVENNDNNSTENKTFSEHISGNIGKCVAVTKKGRGLFARSHTPGKGICETYGKDDCQMKANESNLCKWEEPELSNQMMY